MNMSNLFGRQTKKEFGHRWFTYIWEILKIKTNKKIYVISFGLSYDPNQTVDKRSWFRCSPPRLLDKKPDEFNLMIKFLIFDFIIWTFKRLSQDEIEKELKELEEKYG